MRTLCFYVSDYGYGHAARSIAIIRQLLKQPWVSELFICTSFPMQFIMQSLTEFKEKLRFRNVQNDIGYVLRQGSIEVDIFGLNLEYDRYIDHFDKALSKEQLFLIENKVELVVADIPPVPFLAARSLGIPSIGISNFTWYTAYRGLVPDNKLQILAECYQTMDYFAALTGANEPQWGQSSGLFDFFCRTTDRSEVNRLRSLINPNGDKHIVYFGLGMKIDLASLSSMKLWDNARCAFIVSNNVQFERPNVFQIPKSYVETQNVIAASDVVISKAGWGTISEAIIHNKPLILLDRKQLNEDNNTLGYLENQNRCQVLPWHDISNLSLDKDLFEKLSLQVAHEVYIDNYGVLSQLIDTMRNLIE